MSYRGEDLDLRLAPPRQAGGGSSSGAGDLGLGYGDTRGSGSGSFHASQSARGGPIYVDETLLACCNHAYDVALAHRAGEVRIEHLLYALTRVDAAAEVLETNGIRDAGLRRETATIIASEIPIGLSNGKTTPHRSAAFEEAIKLAAAQAYRRNAAAGVADLLHVFFDVQPDLPGLDVLRKHSPAMGIERQGSERMSMERQSIAYDREPRAPSFYSEYSEFAAPPRERSRRPAAPSYVNDQRLMPLDLAPTTQDNVQNSRLDALEQMVRALGDDLSSERSAFGGLLSELQRDVSAQRQDTSRFSSGLQDRLISIERNVGSGSSGQGGVSSAFVERISGLERALNSRTEELTRQLKVIAERLEDLDSDGGGLGGGEAGKVVSRLEAFERSYTDSQGEANESLLTIGERLKALERVVSTQPEAVVDLAVIENRLSDIETAILSADGPNRDAIQDDRLDTIEEALMARLNEIEQRFLANRSEESNTRAGLQAELKALAGSVAAGTGSAERYASALQERMQSLDQASRQASQDGATLRSEFVTELSDVHEAIMKLNANQHALAESIASGRQEEITAIGSVTHRLSAIESGLDTPQDELARLSQNLDRMYRVTVERYHRRNRFWFWLFGTDDWIGASWPSQTARVEQELRALKRAGNG